MTIRRTLAGLFVISLLVRLLTAWPLRQPGYFDAYYYVNVARNLLHGHGLVENVIWNFLDNPAGIPRPSHLYWMPLSTFLAYAGMRLFGDSYRASQTFFILLSSLLPPLAAWIAYHVWHNIRYAWIAGLLTLFSGFYFIYWVTPENWTPFTLAVDISLLTLYAGLDTGRRRYFAAAGLAAGFAHLARADGVLLLPVALLAIAAQPTTRNPKSPLSRSSFIIHHSSLFILSYFLIMAPWFYRNWLSVGTPLPSAGTKTIFLHSYDDFFSYGLDLSWGSYLAWGIGPIVRSKLDAGLWNLIILAGSLQFFLAPFAMLGWWRSRRHSLWRPFFLYGAALFSAMVLAFTFPSQRGSMLHSAAALIPFACAAVPAGIEYAVAFIARRRRSWDAEEAQRFFGWGFVGLSVLISLFLYAQAIHKPWLGESLLPPWNERSLVYNDVDAWLRSHEPGAGRLLVVDPPALHYFTGREAVAIPNNGVEAIRKVAQRYDVAYLVLEYDHVVPLNGLYQDQQNLAGFKLLARFQDAKSRPVYLFHLAE